MADVRIQKFGLSGGVAVSDHRVQEPYVTDSGLAMRIKVLCGHGAIQAWQHAPGTIVLVVYKYLFPVIPNPWMTTQFPEERILNVMRVLHEQDRICDGGIIGQLMEARVCRAPQ
jgi:hypothetical protein